NPNSYAQLSGNFDAANMGNFNRAGGIVFLSGTFNNAGSFNLSRMGAFEVLNGGTLTGGGTFAAGAGNATLSVNGANSGLNNIALAADATVRDTTLTVTNGLRLDNTINITANNAFTAVNFSGTQTVTGNGTIQFTGANA